MIDPNLIEALKNLQPEHRPIAAAIAHYYKKIKIAERDVEEIQVQLEHQSLEKLFPVQNPINELINGIRPPTSEELEEIQDYLNPGEKVEDVKLKPFDNYWGTILYNCYKKHEGLLEEDQKILKHLKSVYAALTNEKNFKIRFEFEENEYFENKILEKEYFYNPERELPTKITGTDIKWRPGKNVTKKIHKKKQRNKKTGQQRIVEEEVDTGSFFQFFDDIRPAHTEIEEEQRENEIESQHILGQDFLRQIIPNQVEFYLGIIELEEQSGPEDDEDLDDEGQSQDESD